MEYSIKISNNGMNHLGEILRDYCRAQAQRLNDVDFTTAELGDVVEKLESAYDVIKIVQHARFGGDENAG